MQRLLNQLEQQEDVEELDIGKLGITSADINIFMSMDLYKVLMVDLAIRKRMIADEIPGAPLSSTPDRPGVQVLQGELKNIQYVETYFKFLLEEILLIEKQSTETTEAQNESIT